MSITGHKSSSSLEIYQKVNAQEKLQMGVSLANALTNEKEHGLKRKQNDENEELQPQNKKQLV